MKLVVKKLVAQAKFSENPCLLKVYANEDKEVVNDAMMSFLVGLPYDQLLYPVCTVPRC
jgi:hypothetical protein